MYAVMNPDGTLHGLRDGQIREGDNTANKSKPYAVPVVDARPVKIEGQRWVNERKIVTPALVTLTADGVELIPVPTAAEVVDAHMTTSPFARGLVRVLAARFGITPAQLANEIKAQAGV